MHDIVIFCIVQLVLTRAYSQVAKTPTKISNIPKKKEKYVVSNAEKHLNDPGFGLGCFSCHCGSPSRRCLCR